MGGALCIFLQLPFYFGQEIKSHGRVHGIQRNPFFKRAFGLKIIPQTHVGIRQFEIGIDEQGVFFDRLFVAALRNSILALIALLLALIEGGPRLLVGGLQGGKR